MWQADRADEAVTQLPARAQALAARHCDEECALRDARTRTEVYADLAWLLLACGQHGAAQRLPTEYPAVLLQPATTMLDSDDTLSVLKAWTHHANRDHAAAIATLRALLECDGARASVFTELQWRVDLAYFAEQPGERAAAVQWADRLHERAAAVRITAPQLSLGWLARAAEAPYSWPRMRVESEMAWLAAYAPALLRSAP